jgi:thioesterase domain-containing protein
VAFEMARQLEAAGERVAMLALLDVGSPGRNGVAEPGPDAELAEFLRDLRGLAGPDPSGISGTSGISLAGGIDEVLAREEIRQALPSDLAPDRLRDLYALFSANSRMLRAYSPRPYDGRLILVRAEKTAVEIPASGWEDLARRGAEIHTLPGDHYSLIHPPRVSELARLLERCVQQALLMD